MKFKDYYQILGVSRKSTQAQIKAAYRKLAKKFHPDVDKSDSSSKKFKDINEAYEVLSDKEKRSRYDSLGANWQGGQDYSPPPGFDGWGFGQDQSARAPRYRQSYQSSRGTGSGGFEDFGGFSDFFKTIFGDFTTPQPRAQKSSSDFRSAFYDSQKSSAGKSVEKPFELNTTQNINVSAADLMSDKAINIRLDKIVKCTQCGGAGSSCHICGGTGMLNERQNLSVKLPKEVKEGQKIRLAGEGKVGVGGQKGDLFLIVNFKDSEYEIDGVDLTKKISITPSEAVFGCKKDIKTLHGTIGIKIPEKTGSGKTLRLKELGLPKKIGGYGNLNVKINITIPENLSDRQLELYKELSSLENITTSPNV